MPVMSAAYRRPGWRAVCAAISLVSASATFERSARADAAPEDAQSMCISAYESLQEARARGDLLSSREQAFECASSACPGFMQRDCAAWLDEIESEVPSVAFTVRSGGKELGAVRVFEGDRLVAERVDGDALELNPGSHSFRFEADGLEPVTQSIVVERGAKNQSFSVELPAPAPAPARRAPPSPSVAADEERPSPAPWIAGAIGVAGVTAFAILAGSGRAQEASLERSCAPSCSAAELRSVETKYLLADISLGVGITGLLVGGYFLLAPSEPKQSARIRSVSVQALPSGGIASVRSSF